MLESFIFGSLNSIRSFTFAYLLYVMSCRKTQIVYSLELVILYFHVFFWNITVSYSNLFYLCIVKYPYNFNKIKSYFKGVAFSNIIKGPGQLAALDFLLFSCKRVIVNWQEGGKHPLFKWLGFFQFQLPPRLLLTNLGNHKVNWML